MAVSKIQSVIFDKSHFSESDVHEWLMKNNLTVIEALHKRGDQIRARIEDPADFDNFTTKRLTKHIEVVVGTKRIGNRYRES